MAAMKIRTCMRCKGTGYRNCPVLHLGVPGLCYGCDGSGTQGWVEATAITAEKQRARDRHIAELKQEITDIATGYAQGTIRERGYKQWTAEKETLMASMSSAVEPAARGEWRPAAKS